MGDPWTDGIRKGHKLTIKPPSGPWAGAFADAIRQFNSLSRSHKLGVAFEVDRSSGAHVIVDTGADSLSFTYDGQPYSEKFRGNGLIGRTFQLAREGKIEKAYMFLPKSPSINTPQGVRAVGQGVKLVIAVHELVHAAGLADEDHYEGDLFNGNPQPAIGHTAAGDRVVVPSGAKHRSMPPLFLSATTARLVQDLWS